MQDHLIRFPSGISIRRCRDQAKTDVRSGRYNSHCHALNAISQREMGLNWDLAISLLRSNQIDTGFRLFEQSIFDESSGLLGITCLQQDRLTEQQCEQVKEYGYSLINSQDANNTVKGFGLIALGHYYRSARTSDNYRQPHPLFSEYMRHWIYSSQDSFFQGYEKAEERLKQLYDEPGLLGLERGQSYWKAETAAPTMTVADIASVMERYPLLNRFGFDKNYDYRSRDERERMFQSGKSALLKAVDECNRACLFLHHVKPRKTIDWIRSSYGLKHNVENYIRAFQGTGNHYVANGSFICAALHMGFRTEAVGPASPNTSFNFSRRSNILQWRKLQNNGYFRTKKEMERLEALTEIIRL
ncbi:MAG: hypothetical protein OIF55_07785 [Amphritea sp.]|nr:hypothetical protein [Amphritea sp.]